MADSTPASALPPSRSSSRQSSISLTTEHETYEGDDESSTLEPSYHISRNGLKRARHRLFQARRQLLVVFVLFICVFVWFAPPPSTWGSDSAYIQTMVSPLRPMIGGKADKNAPDPARWLRENMNDRHAAADPGYSILGMGGKPKAALISLVRNQELEGIVQSMTQLEFHWNRKYHYPWIFFNDEPFSDEFKVRRIASFWM